MSMSIKPGQFVYVSLVEKKDKYGIVQCSTRRKNSQKEGEFLYSSWYIRFVGNAFKKFDELIAKYVESPDADKNAKGYLKNKFAITLDSTSVTCEPYKNKEDVMVYNNTQFTCFEWSWPQPRNPVEAPANSAATPFDVADEDE